MWLGVYIQESNSSNCSNSLISPADVLDFARRDQDKRRAHPSKTSFAEELRTGYSSSDQLQGEFPKFLGMAQSGVPEVLPAEECGRHVASRFERAADSEL